MLSSLIDHLLSARTCFDQFIRLFTHTYVYIYEGEKPKFMNCGLVKRSISPASVHLFCEITGNDTPEREDERIKEFSAISAIAFTNHQV